MSPLDSSCDSASTSPSSASSSFVYSSHATNPTNGFNNIAGFSSAASADYPTSLKYPQAYLPTMYDGRPRNISMCVPFSHACASSFHLPLAMAVLSSDPYRRILVHPPRVCHLPHKLQETQLQCYHPSVQPQENHTQHHRHISPGTDILLMGILISYQTLRQIPSWPPPEVLSRPSTQCRKLPPPAMATQLNRIPRLPIRSARRTMCLLSRRRGLYKPSLTRRACLSRLNSKQRLTKGFSRPTQSKIGPVTDVITSRSPVHIALSRITIRHLNLSIWVEIVFRLLPCVSQPGLTVKKVRSST